jgi:hypothetical protein
VAKIASGIFGSRAAKRQSQNQILQSTISSNLARDNVLRNATANYGSALVAANRSGGFSPNAFSTSWNNLAADLRQIEYNRIAQNQTALAGGSAGRTSLLNTSIGALSDLSGGKTAALPSSYQSKFLDQSWLGQASGSFGGGYL